VPSDLGEDRRKHLDYIQNAIGRMSTASSTAKGWLLPVVMATYGYALIKHADSIGVLGVLGVALFAIVDGRYLRQERAFRALYRAAVKGTVAVYDMDNGEFFRRPASGTPDLRVPSCRWLNVFRSWSITCFYCPLVGIGFVVTWRAH
jgi:histidine triad (HIT) family protein